MAARAVSGEPELRQAVGPAVSDARARQRAAGPDAQAERPPADAHLRAGPDVPARLVRAAASACRQGPVLPSAAPVRRPAEMFVRAMLRRRTASPSAQSWQAARDEALTYLGIPGGRFWAGKSRRENRTIRRYDEPPAVRPHCGEQRIARVLYFDIITGCRQLCSGGIQEKRPDTEHPAWNCVMLMAGSGKCASARPSRRCLADNGLDLIRCRRRPGRSRRTAHR